jgi:hypothetical protein
MDGTTGSTWKNPEYGTSTLKILADFTFATAAPPVPESSTWAMMILGFAGVGFVEQDAESGKYQLGATLLTVEEARRALADG